MVTMLFLKVNSSKYSSPEETELSNYIVWMAIKAVGSGSVAPGAGVKKKAIGVIFVQPISPIL